MNESDELPRRNGQRQEQEPQLEEERGEAPLDGGAESEAAELELARRLMGEEADGRDPAEEALAALSPRWEVRIQTERDPVAEETAMYRKLAKEVDGRYGEE